MAMRSVRILIVVVLGLLAPRPAAADDAPRTAEMDVCLECHGEQDMSVDLPSGETQPLFVDRATFERSVHGDKLRCTECHQDIDPAEVPHPTKKLKSRREYTIAYYEQCKRCHFTSYTKTLDSVHFSMLDEPGVRAPTCVECHGSHTVTPPGEPRTRISKTCATCHADISRAYEKSVHGKALTEGNGDVAVCTDCHRAHDIVDPRTADFRQKTPALCGSCHTNEQIMARYGLSTKVVETYLADFHGVTAGLRGPHGPTGTAIAATCTDCHGVHDIAKVHGQDAPAMQRELLQTCRKCHPDATENFPAAWLSHYEPTWERAPLVYAVNVFYKGFIPFVVGVLLLQILLHLWRVVVNR